MHQARDVKGDRKAHELPQKKDVFVNPLQLVLSTCDDPMKGKRRQALLLFAWAGGGRRRSEIGTFDMNFLKPLWLGEFNYEMAFSKTNQSGIDGPENHEPALRTDGGTLHRMAASEWVGDGPIFRCVLKDSRVGDATSSAAMRHHGACSHYIQKGGG
uniref:hypothetical protein n=1 Tax=Calothrix sp. FACHB-1219 TaxID=2692778 RepID=UPI0030D97C1D